MARNEFYERLTSYLQTDERRLYRLAYSYAGNEQDALDIMQGAIVKALTARPMREPEFLRTWVYRIVVNTAIDWLRARKRLVPADDEYLEGLAGQPEPPADVDLQRALGRLPTDYRTVVVLRYFEELKLQEIADITAQNLNTVKTRLYRALELLRVEMEAEEHD